MRILIPLIILLMSAICSCRSAKQVAVESADSTRVEVSEVKASISTEELLTAISSSSDIELTDITVEYYEPDTARPDARASPKRLSIGTAKAKSESAATQQAVATAIETDSIDINMERARAEQTQTSADTRILSTTEWVLVYIGANILLYIILLIKYKRK